jgi:hypothetical protein
MKSVTGFFHHQKNSSKREQCPDEKGNRDEIPGKTVRVTILKHKPDRGCDARKQAKTAAGI